MCSGVDVVIDKKSDDYKIISMTIISMIHCLVMNMFIYNVLQQYMVYTDIKITTSKQVVIFLGVLFLLVVIYLVRIKKINRFKRSYVIYCLIETNSIITLLVALYVCVILNLPVMTVLIIECITPIFIVTNCAFINVLNGQVANVKTEESYKELHQQMIPLIAETKRLQHDMNNVLSGIYCDSDITELKQYLQSITTGEQTIDGEHKLELLVNYMIVSKLNQFKILGVKTQLNIQLESPIMAIKGYELTTVLANLLENVKNLEFLQKAEITIHSNPKHCIIKVGNNGHTLSAQQFDKIFSLGYTTKQPSEGHGYGLYTVQEIVKRLEGQILLELTGNNLEDNMTYIVIVIPQKEVTK